MDVNGTPYHLLAGERDWRPRVGDPRLTRLAWDARRASVQLAPREARFPRRASESALTLGDRRGAGADRFGTVYWIAPDRRAILYRPSQALAAGRLWSVDDLGRPGEPELPAGDFRPCAPPPVLEWPELAGLAVSCHHYLVVGTRATASAPAGLLIFDLHAGGPPVAWRFPAEAGFDPFDLAPAPDGGVWILDRSALAGRLWRLDRWFRLQPLGEELASPSPAPAHLVAIETLPDGSVLALESDPARSFSRLHLFRDGAWRAELSLEDAVVALLTESGDPAPSLVGHDLAFLPAAAPPGELRGELYLVADDGNQAFLFDLEIDGPLDEPRMELTLVPVFLPLRRFSGKALLAAGCRVLYDLGDLWLEVSEQPRPRYAPAATLEGVVLDGKEPGCRWHRVLLDAAIPDGTGLRLESRVAELPELLAAVPWSAEPRPYLRAEGSELPLHDPWGLAAEGAGGCPGVGTWELLLQHAQGRYLELRLGFDGNGRATPRLKALRVYYPRFSYLERYLPATYREDEASAHFLDRWLANPEGLLTALEGRIEHAEVWLDARTAPPEALAWLAEWLGASFDADWEEARRRLFLAHAELLFRWRGTPAGLLAAIRIAVEPCPSAAIFDELRALSDPDVGCACAAAGASRAGGFVEPIRIVESFLTRGPLGEQPGATIAASAHRFTVLVGTEPGEDPALREQRLARVRTLVEREKPAHTRFEVQPFWALFQVGSARLGRDTVLGFGSRFVAVVLGASYLGASFLAEPPVWLEKDRFVPGRDAPMER